MLKTYLRKFYCYYYYIWRRSAENNLFSFLMCDIFGHLN